MSTLSNVDYLSLFSALIKKQIQILGPDITFSKVKAAGGIVVDDQGVVNKIEGDPNKIFHKLFNEFLELSSLVVKQSFEAILSQYNVETSKQTQNQEGKVEEPTIDNSIVPRVFSDSEKMEEQGQEKSEPIQKEEK